MATQALSEVREADAPSGIAAIYREIRDATRLPFVNLAWRHMATLPGVLPWVWDTIGPLYRSGAVTRAAAALRAQCAGFGARPITARELTRAGVDPASHATLRDLVESYNRGNTHNLIGWSVLLLRLDHRDLPAQHADGIDDTAPVPDLRPIAALPPLPRRDALAPDTATQLAALCARHPGFPAGAVPSLYLHLAHWPALLAPVDACLAPAFDAHRIAAAAAALATLAAESAARLARRIELATNAPAANERAALRDRLVEFTASGVPDMIAVGTALAEALPAD